MTVMTSGGVLASGGHVRRCGGGMGIGSMQWRHLSRRAEPGAGSPLADDVAMLGVRCYKSGRGPGSAGCGQPTAYTGRLAPHAFGGSLG